jgi:hypothetical protein
LLIGHHFETGSRSTRRVGPPEPPADAAVSGAPAAPSRPLPMSSVLPQPSRRAEKNHRRSVKAVNPPPSSTA